MKRIPDVRYVLISDYATIDQSNKIIIAGMYTEDLVIASVPTKISSLAFTVVMKAPDERVDLRMEVRAPSGQALFGGEFYVDKPEPTPGADPRSIVGFQFQDLIFSEIGKYRILFFLPDDEDSGIEAHTFHIAIAGVSDLPNSLANGKSGK